MTEPKLPAPGSDPMADRLYQLADRIVTVSHQVTALDYKIEQQAKQIAELNLTVEDLTTGGLVPQGYVIVKTSDIRALKQLHDELAEMLFIAPSTDAVAFLARIDALIGGAS